jgi:hypothetical protein
MSVRRAAAGLGAGLLAAVLHLAAWLWPLSMPIPIAPAGDDGKDETTVTLANPGLADAEEAASEPAQPAPSEPSSAPPPPETAAADQPRTPDETSATTDAGSAEAEVGDVAVDPAAAPAGIRLVIEWNLATVRAAVAQLGARVLGFRVADGEPRYVGEIDLRGSPELVTMRDDLDRFSPSARRLPVELFQPFASRSGLDGLCLIFPSATEVRFRERVRRTVARAGLDDGRQVAVFARFVRTEDGDLDLVIDRVVGG